MRTKTMKIKRIFAWALVLVTMALLLAGCGEKQVVGARYNDAGVLLVEYDDNTVQEVTVNNGVKAVKSCTVDANMHVIVTYQNGETEDLGYVGVEVEPPQYTVTFYDLSGNVLKTETLYRGKSATAPQAPAVEDKTFSRWDTDFSDVQSDLAVRPVYGDKAAYTVTFTDVNGKVISTQQVVEGKSAKAPAAPDVTGKVFVKWDTSFENVKSDITVKAVYRDKGNYVVTFKDYSGRVLGTAQAAEGGAATASVTPTREGYTFTGWSPAVNKITKDTTAVAQYKFNGGNNVLDISYKLTAANTVEVTYTVKGTVKFAGCDIEIKAPSELTYKSMTAGENTVVNRSGNSILISVASTTNITKEMKLATVTYTFSGASEANFTVNVSEMFDQNMNNVSYTVVGKKVALK